MSARWAQLGRLAILGALTGVSGAHGAGFDIREAQARLEHQHLIVTAALDLRLSGAVEQALVKGIALDVLIEFRLYQTRRYWWDRRVGEWTLRTQIQYHALSGLYLVTVQGNKEPSTFSSLQGALKYMGTLTRISLPLPPEIAAQGGPDSLGMRVRVDRESLPAPLRPMAYTLAAWRLKSEWRRWALGN